MFQCRACELQGCEKETGEDVRRCKRSITWAMQALVDDNHAAQEELWEAQGLHLLVRQLHDCASWQQQQQQLLQQPTHSAGPLQSIPSSSMSPPVSPVGLDRRSSSMMVCLSARNANDVPGSWV